MFWHILHATVATITLRSLLETSSLVLQNFTPRSLRETLPLVPLHPRETLLLVPLHPRETSSLVLYNFTPRSLRLRCDRCVLLAACAA